MEGSNIIGLDIRNPQNETIGEVKDVLVGQDGKVQKVVVSVGGFLGIGEKRVAIDWDDLKMNSQQQVASVNMTKEQLQQAPEYKAPERAATDRPATSPATRPGAGGAPPSRTQ